MNEISRRIFFKATAILGVTLAIGKYVSAKTLSFTDLINPAHAVQGGAKKVVPVVSDVDAHSQCKMRVGVLGGKVTTVDGDPSDPESKGQLTVRGKYMKEILYAPDRIDPRVVHLYHGFKESNFNVLTDHKAFDPITESTGLKSLLCKVEKV